VLKSAADAVNDEHTGRGYLTFGTGPCVAQVSLTMISDQ
jgi:hypothetical protein